jgi:hypothetical protein
LKIKPKQAGFVSFFMVTKETKPACLGLIFKTGPDLGNWGILPGIHTVTEEILFCFHPVVRF